MKGPCDSEAPFETGIGWEKANLGCISSMISVPLYSSHSYSFLIIENQACFEIGPLLAGRMILEVHQSGGGGVVGGQPADGKSHLETGQRNKELIIWHNLYIQLHLQVSFYGSIALKSLTTKYEGRAVQFLIITTYILRTVFNLSVSQERVPKSVIFHFHKSLPDFRESKYKSIILNLFCYILF